VRNPVCGVFIVKNERKNTPYGGDAGGGFATFCPNCDFYTKHEGSTKPKVHLQTKE